MPKKNNSFVQVNLININTSFISFSFYMGVLQLVVFSWSYNLKQIHYVWTFFLHQTGSNWQIKQGKTTVPGFGSVKICFKDKIHAQIIPLHDHETKKLIIHRILASFLFKCCAIPWGENSQLFIRRITLFHFNIIFL